MPSAPQPSVSPALPPGELPTPRFATEGAAADRADAAALAIAGIAGGCAILAPVMLGSSGPWSRLGLEAAMAAMAGLWGVFLCRSPRVPAVILAVCALALLQTVPLPDAVLSVVAPLPAKLWRLVGGDAASAWHPISVDPAATATGVRRMLLWLASAMAVRDAAARAGGRRTLATALAISAAVVWALAVAFPVDRDDPRLLGTVPLQGPTIRYWMNGDRLPVQSDGGGFLDWTDVGGERYRYDQVMAGDGMGPYWSSNQFACAMVLTVPFLLGACLSVAKRFGFPRLGFLAAALLLAAASAALWKAEARSGMASLVLGVAVFLQAAIREKWTRRIAAAGAVGSAGALLLFIAGYTGMVPNLERFVPEPYRDKAAALLDNNRSMGTRIAGAMILGAPILGVGINSYASIYPEISPGDYDFYYAYDDYAQLVAESGFVGMLFALALAIPVGLVVWRTRWCHGSGEPILAASMAALAGGLANMFFEWMLHQPANGFLSCVVVGLVMATKAGDVNQSRHRRASSARLAGPLSWAFVGVCVLALILLARDARSDAVTRVFRQALGTARPVAWRGDRPEARPLLEAAIDLGEKAARWDAGNPRLALVQGQAHLHLAALGEGVLRDSHEAYAESFFRRCRRLRGATLGLPEPIPPAAP